MSRINRKDYKKLLGQWKLIDDMSGFEIMSNDAVFDYYRGLITSKDNFDPPGHHELPTSFHLDPRPLPIIRPEPADRFVPDTLSDLVWGTADVTWGEADITWGDL